MLYLRSRGDTPYIGRMRNDANINLRLPSDLRSALDALAAKSTEQYGVDLATADLLRIGAYRLLANPNELFKPPVQAVEGPV
jgi:hypothetical protein